MGNAVGKLTPCSCTGGEVSRRHHITVVLGNQLDEGLGHSFCYTRPDLFVAGATQMAAFRTISGASISANASTPLSTTLFDPYPSGVVGSAAVDRASSFSSSSSFAAVPLQPIPRGVVNSGPLPTRSSGSMSGSGLSDRVFLSGPIERGFMSGPIDRSAGNGNGNCSIKNKYKFNKWGSIKGIKDAIFSKIWGNEEKELELEKNNESIGKSSVNLSSQVSLCDENEGENDGFSLNAQNLQWAQGKAGEDRVHVVVSEEFGWVFVGIYDGFNGPDAPDFLMSNLYSAVHKELKGLLWNDKSDSNQSTISTDEDLGIHLRRMSATEGSCSGYSNTESGVQNSIKKSKHIERKMANWDDKLWEKLNQLDPKWGRNTKHSDVLKALSEALRKTEEAYLDIADKMVRENPVLCLMGSCVLVMLMTGEDIYLMNVGDSRAVLGQKAEPDVCFEKALKDLERINKESVKELHALDIDIFDDLPNISSLQLTVDHNTYIKEEVQRIKHEHPDDPSAVLNDRVKGSLKVTRAFGAGFLKQPKWNEALLQMFRIDYVGTSPYITCSPSLHHHRLGPRDRFLILSSDGLYQYFTSEEAVSEVEMFICSYPEGDPAQHLIEEVLSRAAKNAGMDFHELLEIPQGERRRYHDDVSVVIISLEGMIWRSSL